MKPQCRTQLNAARIQAGGKALTDAQADAIDTRMRATMRRLAVADKDWQTYPADQRLMLAAQQAMADIKAEAQRKVDNATRQALRTAETEQRIADAMKRQPEWSRSRTLVEDMQRAHADIDGIKRDYSRRLMDLIDAADSGQGASLGRRILMVMFDAQNPLMTRDLAMEVYSKGKAGTGNELARKGAESWLKVAEDMRQRFNAAGGDVGKLDYGYLPLPDDNLKILAAGRDKWVADALPDVNRDYYLREDGSRMDDAEVANVLGAIWETKATDGANKAPPGQFNGEGARSNRGSQSRELHFKDGDAYLRYMERYGTGSMYDAMIGHIGGLARDIGLVERYGPNPEAQMRLQFDLAQRADGARGFFGQIAEDQAGPEAQWSVLSGASGSATPRRAAIAGIAQHARNIETFGKLQGAVLSSITDLGTYFVATDYNRMPYFEALRNIGRAATGDTRDFMNAHGLIAESMISDLNRWSGENVAQSWSGRIAAATMRLSLMNAWTDTLRRAFQLTMMQSMGRMRSKAWDSLKGYDRYLLEAKGFTAEDWAVIQQVKPVTYRGAEFVTPEGIYATGDARAAQIVARFIGAISDESEIAVLNPDLTTRAIATGGGRQAGTVGGEMARAVAQFKSFPIAMISRHWRRMLDTPQGLEGAPVTANRLAYAGALMVSLTALGAIAFQTKQVVTGKDPVDMTTPKFWGRAVAQGGGLGFFGDMLFTDPTDSYGGGPFEKSIGAFGPVGGSVGGVVDLTFVNAWEAAKGKQTHFGAEAVKLARSHVPLVNLWYAKAAIDHAGLHALQENMSPGYLARIKNKARKDWGQQYWWEPGDALPDRAPSFEQLSGR